MSTVDDEDELDWEEWDPRRISFFHHMIAGSCAGLAEHVSIFPIDTLKTHVQCERCGSTSPMQTWNCATRIVGREGIFRLWRGVSAMFAGCIPGTTSHPCRLSFAAVTPLTPIHFISPNLTHTAHAAYFSIFESMKILLGADKSGHHPLRAAGCGATAALAHDMFMTPFDTVKQRMQLGYYKNVVHCVQTVARQEGIWAFYLSLPTTLAMNLPYGSVMVAVNESARKLIAPGEVRISFTTSMLAGSIAGAVAAAVTTPLDVIKTRLQTQNLEPCPKVASTAAGSAGGVGVTVISSKAPVMAFGSSPTLSLGGTRFGFSQVIFQIYRDDGFKGFLRGMTPRMLLHAPAVAISWTAYETMKDLLVSATGRL